MDLPENSTRKSVPLIGRRPGVTYLIVMRRPFGVVQRYIIFKGVGARDVIIVAVLEAPHESAGLILPAQRAA